MNGKWNFIRYGRLLLREGDIRWSLTFTDGVEIDTLEFRKLTGLSIPDSYSSSGPTRYDEARFDALNGELVFFKDGKTYGMLLTTTPGLVPLSDFAECWMDKTNADHYNAQLNAMSPGS